VRWGFKVAQSDTLFHLRAGRWQVVWARATDRPADGACAFVPARVVRELFVITCPGFAALHGRPVTRSELGALTTAFRTSPLTRYWRDAQRLANACILSYRFISPKNNFSLSVKLCANCALILFNCDGSIAPIDSSKSGASGLFTVLKSIR
jgi:hypothetical protein